MANSVQVEQAKASRIQIIEGMYKMFPIGVEQDGTGARQIAESLGSTQSVVGDLLTTLESGGIISRRITFPRGKGGYGGRMGHLTIKKPKDEAIALLNTPINNSLKDRVLLALSQTDKPLTTSQLGYILNMNGGSSDFHNLTHILHSLKRQGKITFHTDSTKDKIPYDIRLISEKKIVAKSSPVVKVLPIVAPVVEQVTEEEIVEQVSVVDYPIARKLSARMELLSQAAMLAEQAEVEDIAILLQERMTLSDLEKEHIALYTAYMACVKG